MFLCKLTNSKSITKSFRHPAIAIIHLKFVYAAKSLLLRRAYVDKRRKYRHVSFLCRWYRHISSVKGSEKIPAFSFQVCSSQLQSVKWIPCRIFFDYLD